MNSGSGSSFESLVNRVFKIIAPIDENLAEFVADALLEFSPFIDVPPGVRGDGLVGAILKFLDRREFYAFRGFWQGFAEFRANWQSVGILSGQVKLRDTGRGTGYGLDEPEGFRKEQRWHSLFALDALVADEQLGKLCAIALAVKLELDSTRFVALVDSPFVLFLKKFNGFGVSHRGRD